MAKYLICGGGTGGHVYPAIAIAKCLKENDSNAQLLFIGAKRKLEMVKVPAAGFEIKGFWIRGFQRGQIWTNLLLPIKVLFALIRSFFIILEFKPDVIIGVGGYSSGPVLKMGSWLGKKILIQEQNSYPGMTNRMLSQSADTICVAYANMERFFPGKNLQLTGNPVRSDLIDMGAKRYLDLILDPKKKTVLVMGGSLGALSINRAMAQSTKVIEAEKDIQWLWQIGSLYQDEFEDCDTCQLVNVEPVIFIDDMANAYNCADVIVCRAGATTISELCVVGKPCILIPSPNVAEDHQTKNAQALVDAGGALMINDNSVMEIMVHQAISLLKKEDHMTSQSEALKKLAKPNASDLIVKQIEMLTNE